MIFMAAPFPSSVIFSCPAAPGTSYAMVVSKPNPKSGYVNWPGDSLKILFTTTIPSSLPNLIGYPGLYKEAFLTTTFVVFAFDASLSFFALGILNPYEIV